MTISMNQSSVVFLVKYENENFIVENLESREVVMIPSSELMGNSYKYPNDFERKFTWDSFSLKNGILILTDAASRKIDDLIYFNRIDN